MLRRNQQLKRIGSSIASLNACLEAMRRSVLEAHLENGPVLEEASALLSQKHDHETKRELLEAFNKHFIVSEDDLNILESTAEPTDDKFFIVLRRVKRIHADCQLLLGTENQRLGLELMEQSSRNLNNAFQKLFKWIQREFKTLNLENPQISSSIRRSLRVLAERPTLFERCLDFFAEAREHVLSDAFYSALTGSSRGHEQDSMTKPIEFQAHDPLRYVGDMLAWIHSAAVSEREALEVLFISDGDEIAKGIQAGIESEPWSRVEGEVFDGQKALGELVNRNLSGIGRSLRQRVEQVVQSHEDSVLTYKIANLIKFYRLTFIKLLGPESSIVETLSNLEDSTFRHFQAIMKGHAISIHAELSHPPLDLSIPDFLDETLTQLTALMKSYDASLTPATSKATDFQPVLRNALDPFLAGCDSIAKHLEEPATSIFSLNCILATKATLLPHDFTTSKLSQINETMDVHTSQLIEYQHAFLLHTSGLHPLIAALAPLSTSPSDTLKIPSLDPFQPQALTATSQILDDFLPSALLDAMDNLKQLSSVKMAEDITGDAADRFCEDFEFVEGRLEAVDELVEAAGQEGGEEEGRVSLRTAFPRTSGEIRVLLS